MALLKNSKADRLLSEINVTPLVDVSLVLLVIFMVAAPLVQQGVDVDLPQAKAKPIASQEEHLTLTLTKNKKIFINKLEVDPALLQEKLKKIFQQRTDRQLFFKADKKLPYGFVMQIMAEIKNAGIQKLGIITVAPEKT